MNVTNYIKKRLEQVLPQHIQALYLNQIGQETGRVTCRLFDRQLIIIQLIIIIIENTVTKLEKLLLRSGQETLARQICWNLEDIIRPSFRKLVGEVINTPIADLLLSTHLDTGHTSAIALLAEAPASITETSSQSLEDLTSEQDNNE
jgi:uncharacterized protein YbcI